MYTPPVRSISDLADNLSRLSHKSYDLSRLKLLIGDILASRAHVSHANTSKVLWTDGQKLDKPILHRELEQLDSLLVRALDMLPDNRPSLPSTIVTPSGKRMVLQQVSGDNARYVTIEDYSALIFAYNPSSRIERLRSERAIQHSVEHEIIVLEAAKLSAVHATEREADIARIAYGENV